MPRLNKGVHETYRGPDTNNMHINFLPVTQYSGTGSQQSPSHPAHPASQSHPSPQYTRIQAGLVEPACLEVADSPKGEREKNKTREVTNSGEKTYPGKSNSRSEEQFSVHRENLRSSKWVLGYQSNQTYNKLGRSCFPLFVKVESRIKVHKQTAPPLKVI